MTDSQPPLVALESAREMRWRLGRHAHQVILFGLRACGDAGPASDYDLVVVDDLTRALRDLVAEAGDQLLDARDALCAAV